MELMEAIKTCIDAKVSIQTYQCMPDEVFMEAEDFLKEFEAYDDSVISKDEDDGEELHLLFAEKDGIVFKAYAWASELKVRE